MIKVLQGLTVVEQGTFITGPAAGMLLGDLGADVIKVEQPGPATRSAPSRAASTARTSRPTTATSAASRSTPRRGRSRGLRRPDRRGRRLHPELPPRRRREARRRRSTPARAQPEADLLRDQRFRRRPARPRDRPAYDTVAQAASGFLSLLVNPQNPRVIGPAIADSVTGFYAAYGIMGALFERGRTGTGRTRRRLDAGGDDALQPRRLHPLLLRSTKSWARTAGPACRSPTCSNAPTANGSRCTCPRRRSSGRAWRWRSNSPTCSRTRALPHATARIAAPGNADRACWVERLQAPHARRMVRTAATRRRAARADVRHQRGADRSAGACTCSSRPRPEHPVMGLFRTVRSPVPSTASARSTCARRRRWASTTMKSAQRWRLRRDRQGRPMTARPLPLTRRRDRSPPALVVPAPAVWPTRRDRRPDQA